MENESQKTKRKVKESYDPLKPNLTVNNMNPKIVFYHEQYFFKNIKQKIPYY